MVFLTFISKKNDDLLGECGFTKNEFNHLIEGF